MTKQMKNATLPKPTKAKNVTLAEEAAAAASTWRREGRGHAAGEDSVRNRSVVIRSQQQPGNGR